MCKAGRIAVLAFLFIVLSAKFVDGQTILYQNDFQNSKPFAGCKLINIDKGIPSDTVWKLLADSSWVARNVGSSQNRAAFATSAYTTEVSADDWLITPPINAGEMSKLKFKYKSFEENKNDNIEICVSNTEPTVAGFLLNPVLYQISSSNMNDFEEITIDLNSYKNSKIYLAFRFQGNSGDLFAIDDIVVEEYVTDFKSLNFIVDMSIYESSGAFNPNKDFVDIAGNFNDWNGSNHVMHRGSGNDSSLYSLSVNGFEVGDTLEFKFRINGSWNDSIIEFPNGKPNRIWIVEEGIYSYKSLYNNIGNPFGIPFSKINNISISPNPFHDVIRISQELEMDFYKIFTIDGKLIKQGSINVIADDTMNLNFLSKGMYQLVFYNKGRILGVQKIIKQ